MAEIITCYDDEKIILDGEWYNKVDKICKKILAKIKPSTKEQIKILNEVNSFCNTLQKMVGKKAVVQIAGSLGKGTNLK